MTAIICTSTGHCLTAEQLIKEGDAYDLKFRASEALDSYLLAEKLDPNNVHILVSVARQYRHLMQDASSSTVKMRLAKKALDYSQRAAALAPNDSEAQLSPAITYGKMIPFQGTKEQVQYNSLIKAAADKAIKLDPQNDLAWHVLGRWHQAVAGVGSIKRTMGQLIYGKLPTSTYDEAVKCFNKAIEINPQRLRHYIELGRTYAFMGKTGDAKKYIQKGLDMPETEKDDSELKQRGRETLAKL